MSRFFVGFCLVGALLSVVVGCRGRGGGDSGSPGDGDADVDADSDVDADADGDRAPDADGHHSECPDGRSLCDSQCVDTMNDPRYCGSCTRSCDPGHVCDEGQCRGDIDCRQEPCIGLTYCNLADGQCLPGCSGSDQCGQGETCDLPSHQCLCQEGSHRCQGMCVSLSSAEGHPCANGYYCDFEAGSCVPGCAFDSQCGVNERCDTSSHQCGCQPAHHECDGACVDDTSPQSCGTSCTPCPGVTHGSATCVDGECGLGCGTGYRLCEGACAPCPDYADGLACDGSGCVATSCRNGYHLCGDECFSDADVHACGADCRTCPEPSGTGMEVACIEGQCTGSCRAGTSMCHGRCLAGDCVWTSASGTGAEEIGVDVDDTDVVHVATTADHRATHYRVLGRQLVVTEPSPTMPCFEDDYYSVDTRPLVYGGSDGNVTIACIRGNGVWSVSWDGDAWRSDTIQSSNSLNSSPAYLQRVGRDLLGYFWYYPNHLGGTREAIARRLVDDQWDVVLNPRCGGIDAFHLLGGEPGDTQVAWVDVDETELDVAFETGEDSMTIPDVALAYARDGRGAIVGVSAALTYYQLQDGQWDSESITTSAATSLDLVVDQVGNVHVAWVNDSGVYYALRSEGEWSHEQVSDHESWFPDLEVGSSGKVAIAVLTGFENFTVFE